ncbi:MAG: paraquat-inducible protein A [Elusimicrobia bacterium]|nr:paraquat-inducible protein A [Candidatus Liberimonas magnetica]
MKQINLILSLVIIMVSAVLCQQIISNSISNQKNKNDYAELNHIKYGLLSVDEWKRQLSVILTEEINKLSLSRTNERALRKHIEVLLNTLIDKVAKNIKKENKGSAGGWFKQAFMNIFVSIKDIKKGIPEYTNAILREMTTVKTEGQLKDVLNKQLKQYISQTHNTQDTSKIDSILLKTDSKDVESARIKLNEVISVKYKLVSKETVLLIILSISLFALSGFSEQPLVPSRYLILVASLILLLVTGVTTPMIDIEAKISHMSFVLLGHPIQFENQVLYFQSKSIVDIFRIMIVHKDIEMKLVGLLVITFSIFFPLLKIASSVLYYYNFHSAKENPVIKFFVLKSGKWSMADVMVVAIFMAYVGFNGIITSQLSDMKIAAGETAMLTTNGTSLEPGYYLFLTYTLLALFLSGYLTRNPKT